MAPTVSPSHGTAGRNGLFVMLTAAFMLLPAGACVLAGRAPASGEPSGATAVVTKVTDGDTVHVEYRGRDERVRLIGVNTPEVAWYGGRGECFGSDAGVYTRHRLLGQTVAMRFDVGRRDRYGRLLAYIYVGPELFNLTLVQRGYARADPVPPDTEMAGTFASAERQARAAGEGLWSACPAE